MVCGSQKITVQGIIPVTVDIAYVRDGRGIEFLEGWINPMVESMLSPQERVNYVLMAKSTLLQRILQQVTKLESVKSWEGVTYG